MPGGHIQELGESQSSKSSAAHSVIIIIIIIIINVYGAT